MDYVNAVWNGSQVRLYRRAEDGRLTSRDVRADFAVFVRASDYPKIQKAAERASSVRGTPVRDGDYYRISFRENWMRREIIEKGFFEQAGVEIFEADVDPVRRYMIDSGSTIQRPRWCYLDIEADSRVKFIHKERARLLNWAIVDEAGNTVFDVLDEDTDRDERALLGSLLDALDPYDMVCAWNGDSYDFPVLEARFDMIFRNRNALRRLLLLDQMLLFRKMNVSASGSGDEKQSTALNRVYESVLKVEDVKRLVGYGVGPLAGVMVGGARSWDFWRAGGENRDLGARYNCLDAFRQFEIEAKLGYIAQHYEVSATCGVFPDTRGMRAVRFVETFMMRIGAARGVRAPSKFHGDEPPAHGEKYKGAWVLESTPGLYRDVHIFDFSGMYPSIMIAWNMSPEMRAPEHDVQLGSTLKDGLPPAPPPGISIAPITGKAFRTDVEGMIIVGVKELRAGRARWQAEMKKWPPQSPEWKAAERRATAYKNVINSLYGVLGSQFCRFHQRDVAESITQVAVFLNREVTFDEARRRFPGIRFVAADTDSGMLTGPTAEEMVEFVKHCNANVYPRVLTHCGCVDTTVVKLDYEKQFELMINSVKKRYAGRLKHYKGQLAAIDAEPVIKGFEFMRGDGAKLGRDFQKQVIHRLLLLGLPVPEKYPLTAEKFQLTIEDLRQHVLTAKLEQREFVLAQSLNKALNEYERKPLVGGGEGSLQVHVEIALKMAAEGLEVGEGTRIEYVVVDGDATPIKAVPLHEYVPGTEDRHYLWEKKVWPPTRRVLEAVFPNFLWGRYDESKPRTHGVGRGRVLAGQTRFGFLENDWGDGDLP